jgi:hypothetical protein
VQWCKLFAFLAKDMAPTIVAFNNPLAAGTANGSATGAGLTRTPSRSNIRENSATNAAASTTPHPAPGNLQRKSSVGGSGVHGTSFRTPSAQRARAESTNTLNTLTTSNTMNNSLAIGGVGASNPPPRSISRRGSMSSMYSELDGSTNGMSPLPARNVPEPTAQSAGK